MGVWSRFISAMGEIDVLATVVTRTNEILLPYSGFRQEYLRILRAIAFSDVCVLKLA